MLESNTRVINLPIWNTEFVNIVSKAVDKTTRQNVVMTSISEEEEYRLDTDKKITIVRDNILFTVNIKNVYCYGVIDFDDYSDDYNAIDNFDWFKACTTQGKFVPNNYNYESHAVEQDSKNKYIQDIETWSPAQYTQYLHGCLGKPHRVLIFNRTYKTKHVNDIQNDRLD